MTTHPLIQRLFEQYRYPPISADDHDAFVCTNGHHILFFAGDPARHRDTTDVAVVLPELAAAFPGQFDIGVITADSENVLQQRYGFTAWPALVFLRSGGYLGVITGIRNWDDYLREIPALLDADTRPAPGFKIPVVNG